MLALLAHMGEASETGEMTEMMRRMGMMGWSPLGGWGWMTGGWLWLGQVIWLVTWVLVILVLVALVRWLWKKGNK